MSKLRSVTCAVAALLASIPAASQFAQRSSISGTVTDPTGATVPNAAVTLIDLDQKKDTTARTNTDGQYTFTQLNVGHYQVSVDMPGFDKAISNPIELTTQQNAKFDFSLKTGNVHQTVEVTSAAPLIETDRASLEQNVTLQQIQSLPLNGRNYTSLAALVPSVATTPLPNVNPGGTFNVGANHASGGTQYAVGGQFEGVPPDNGYYINGVNATENYQGGISYAISPDAIQDARIAVSDFSAASGHDISTFEVSTRAGTSQFHGQLYDYLENDALNARNPYDEAVGLSSKPTLRRNQFGGGLGGPVMIPHVFEKLKERAFFFANWEQWLERNGLSNTTAYVPTQAERNGDFGGLCAAGFDGAGSCLDPTQQIYNPYTTTYDANGNGARSPFPYNQIPANLISPQAMKLAQLYPLPNAYNPANLANGFDYITTSNHAASVYHYDSRFDYRISDKNSFFVTFSKSHGVDNNTGGVFPDYQANTDDRSWLASVNDAHIFTPNLTNEFIFGVGGAQLVTVPPSEISFLNSSNNPFNQIFTNTGTGQNAGVLGLYLYGNYADPGFEEVFKAGNLIYQTSDNVSWVHGVHNFTFGMNYFDKGEDDWDINRYVSFGCAQNYIQGTCAPSQFTASGSGTSAVGGDAFADLLMGLPSEIHQRYNVTGSSPTAPELDVRFPYWGFYANDRMQVNKKLSISLGLRYDLIIPIYAPNNLCCALLNNTPAGYQLQIPGIAPGVPQHFLSARKTNFAPRISVAYQIKPKLVFRAGYGIFYDEGGGQISGAVGNALNGVPGYFVGQDLNNTVLGAPAGTPVLTLANVFPAAAPVAPGTYPVSTGPGTGLLSEGGASTVYTFDNQSSIVPRYQRYLADFQYELTNSAVFTLQYNGDMGKNGAWYQGENLPNNTANNFGTVYYLHPGLTTNYNALVVTFEKRMSHGLSIISNYSFSKTLANRSSIPGGDNVWTYNLDGSYGLATLDHPHRFVFSAVWQPTYGQSWIPIAKTLLTGWQITTITTLESGNRYSALNDSGPSANPNGPDLLSINAGADPNLGHFNKSFDQQFNTSAFYVPTGVIGNTMPGLIQGPGQINADISAGKTFSLRERLKLDFRADFYNAFNHAQWLSISTEYPVDPNSGVPFGRVEGGREGRIIQLGAKVHF